MKKSLVSALTTALVVGAASTTFAAANPFSDVAADHWAYDAVAQLAQEGIVTGYADSSFQGDTTMTRYEMAQIVAKAMAKQDTVNASQKAMIDKLAAEFSDELANLGVRVAALESKVDNVKWTGVLRYSYTQSNHENGEDESGNTLKMRLTPTYTINDHWTAYARVDANLDMNKNDNKEATFNRAWAQGEYGNLTIKLGKFPTLDNSTHGLLADVSISGAQVTFGNAVKTQLTAGRWSDNVGRDVAATYVSADVQATLGKLDAGVGYHRWNDIENAGVVVGDKDKLEAAGIGAGYKFDDNWYVTADYAKFKNVANDDRYAYNFQANFKGADKTAPGSYGLYVAYRKANQNKNTLGITFDTADGAQKGWMIGGDVALAKNVVAVAQYFWGKDYTNNDQKKNSFYSEINFLF